MQKAGVPACRCLCSALEKIWCTCAALHVAGVVPLFELSLSVRCHNRCHGGCTPGQPLSTCAAASVGSGAPADWLCGSVDFLLSRRESAAPLPAPPPNQQTGSSVKTQGRRDRLILGTRTLPPESPGLVQASDESGCAVGVPLVDSRQLQKSPAVPADRLSKQQIQASNSF